MRGRFSFGSQLIGVTQSRGIANGDEGEHPFPVVFAMGDFEEDFVPALLEVDDGGLAEKVVLIGEGHLVIFHERGGVLPWLDQLAYCGQYLPADRDDGEFLGIAGAGRGGIVCVHADVLRVGADQHGGE